MITAQINLKIKKDIHLVKKGSESVFRNIKD